MESHIWPLPAISVALWGKGSEKERWLLLAVLSGTKLSPSSHPDAGHFSSSPYAWCLSSILVLKLKGSKCRSVKRNCLGIQQFFPPTQPLLVFTARIYGDLSSWHWNPGLGGPGVGLRLLTPEMSLPNFYPLRMGVGPACSTSLPCPPVWMDAFLFFIP